MYAASAACTACGSATSEAESRMPSVRACCMRRLEKQLAAARKTSSMLAPVDPALSRSMSKRAETSASSASSSSTPSP